MLKNYLRLALRNLWKNKLVTSINLLGLTIGIGFSLLLFMYVNYENSYDAFFNDGDRVYRLISQETGQNARKIALSGNSDFEDLSTNYAGVEEAIKIRNFSYDMFPEGEDAKTVNVDFLFATDNFFSSFGFPLIDGSADQVLSDPSSIVITDELAMKMFGRTDVVGETITVDAAAIVVYKKNLVISGVTKKMLNSHMQFEAVIPWNMSNPDGMKIADAFFGGSSFSYMKVREGASAEVIAQEMNKRLKSVDPDVDFEYYFQPLNEMYLNSGDISFLAFETGNSGTVNTLFFVAIVILLVACINYINLQTAKGSNRSLEVGVKKVLGASKQNLVMQFLSESVAVTLVASVFAVLLVDIVLPTFNGLTGKSFDIGLLTANGMFEWLLVIFILTSLLSGIYPAFVLSSFKPSRVLKSSNAQTTKNGGFRKALLLVQFGISICLIAVTLIIVQQSRFISRKEMGFNKDQVLNFGLNTPNIQNSMEAFRNELDQYPNILATSVSTDIIGTGFTNNSGTVFPQLDFERSSSTTIFGVDHSFVNTYELKLNEGRDFDLKISSDSNAVVVNRALVEALGLENPIGQKVVLYQPQGPAYEIIGVLEDFHFQKLHQKINPVVLRIARRNIWRMSVRIAPGNMEATLGFLESKWSEFESEKPFTYQFVDQQFQQFYEDEQRMLKSIGFFSVVSVVLTILGLFAMTVFSINQKMKEIGIRKVLGAQMSHVFSLIYKEFLLILAIAIVAATPLVYYFGNSWLERFAYRIDVSVWPVLISSLITLFAISAIITTLAYRAAVSNPLDSLRTE